MRAPPPAAHLFVRGPEWPVPVLTSGGGFGAALSGQPRTEVKAASTATTARLLAALGAVPPKGLAGYRGDACEVVVAVQEGESPQLGSRGDDEGHRTGDAGLLVTTDHVIGRLTAYAGAPVLE